MKKPVDIEEYISRFPKDIQKILVQIRATIRKSAPRAEEIISYGMPAYKLDGMLVWFAAHSKHVGLYPGSAGIEAFKNQLTDYKWSKGAVQFPFDKPLPIKLITSIVKFKVKYNSHRLAMKKMKK